MILRVLITRKVFHFFNEIMDVHQIYCGNHFMMCVSQIIILYILNLYSVICQLYLNKTGRKNGENMYQPPVQSVNLSTDILILGKILFSHKVKQKNQTKTKKEAVTILECLKLSSSFWSVFKEK